MCVMMQMSRMISHRLQRTCRDSSQFILDFRTAEIPISVSEMKTLKLTSSLSYLIAFATRTKVSLSL